MSVSRNKKRKAARAARTGEQADIMRKIRQGILPQFFLSRQQGAEDPNMLERTTKVVGSGKSTRTVQRRTWRLVSTYKTLAEG